MHRHNFGAWGQVFREKIYEADTHRFVDQVKFNERICQDESCGFVQARRADI